MFISKIKLRKHLEDYSKEELITLLINISDSYSQVKEYLTLQFSDNENIVEVLQKYKEKVKNEFFPKRGNGRLSIKEAKGAISDFKKLCKDKSMIIDLKLFFVENCVKFIDDYGDINEPFYDCSLKFFSEIVEDINSEDQSLFDLFADRLKYIAENASDGYGFRDDLGEYYEDIRWVSDDEDF